MELLLEIKDKKIPTNGTYKTRNAARAVIFDENNLVPLLYNSKYNYHKIPGGGIDSGENQVQALLREVLEETGCIIKTTGEVGQIVEFRSEFNLLQTSYCYLGEVIAKGETNFTKDELSNGFKLVWLTLDEAISTIENDKPTDYEGSFIQQRDIMFLKKVQQMKRVN